MSAALCLVACYSFLAPFLGCDCRSETREPSCAERGAAIRRFIRLVYESPLPSPVKLTGPLAVVDRPPKTGPTGHATPLHILVGPEGIRAGDDAAAHEQTDAVALVTRRLDRRRAAAVEVGHEWNATPPAVLSVTPDAPVTRVRDALGALAARGIVDVYLPFDVPREHLPQPPDPALVRSLRSELAEAGFRPYPTFDDPDDGDLFRGRSGWLSARTRAAARACPGMPRAADGCLGKRPEKRSACYADGFGERIVACGCTEEGERFLALLYVGMVPERPVHFHHVRLSPSASPVVVPAAMTWQEATPAILGADANRFWLNVD